MLEISFISHQILHKIIMFKHKDQGKAISASEISQYVYCPVSWYLKRSGVRPQSPGLQRGIAEHKKAGGRLALLERREKTAGAFRWLGAVCFLLALLLAGRFLWMHY